MEDTEDKGINTRQMVVPVKAILWLGKMACRTTFVVVRSLELLCAFSEGKE